mmetsp:Transcript_6593/g.12431  ORF Transcript_6593/g.12431 Transcript_6593/m.12431 type:complete len:465 (+) Transcript_6593:561-1955(+)|eukprot:CAMPEP_0176501476 /NCGR_PEP_ID=MMETSP0200_2-20121128/14179_1 /TAXON_ID=947934 /ORGANISM="Chaetoceros sp., Strain GSL56" /LENGTH=464 /DNA_ID=CAMNT_0017900361 /DNA_START=76 /DNA_END=1470 /DNA_ORIENTATION=+
MANNKKKTAAQIRRMEIRAQQRGQTYEYKEPHTSALEETNSNAADSGRPYNETLLEEDKVKYEAAFELKSTLDELEKNPLELNSKDKRSARRKAEALAVQKVKEATTGTKRQRTVDDAIQLMEWFHNNRKQLEKKFSSHAKKNGKEKGQGKEDAAEKLDSLKLLTVQTYHSTMSEIEKNQNLNAKDRRSAKRKAEAIALQETNMETMEDLIDWYQENHHRLEEQQMIKGKKRKLDDDNDDAVLDAARRKNPYILFVGQIPFSTSSDDIFQHFQKYMGKDVITRDCMQIRIPKDENAKEKNGKSESNRTKGFAFVEFQDPKIMHECLKMHHTSLSGRRINVIQAAGGGKAARAQKQKERKLEQDEYISSTVDKIIREYIESGKLKDGELDKGSISLCKRRNAAIVEAALLQYIEKRGDKELENPSAFFTKVMCKITDDDTDTNKANAKKQKVVKRSMPRQKGNRW